LKASNSKEIIKNIYDDNKLIVREDENRRKINMKKDIFNPIPGKYNKIRNETFSTKIATDYNQALDTKKT